MANIPSNRYPFTESHGHPGSVVWYLSFGDLLTLLLCFFLVLTPWTRPPKGQNSESLPRFSLFDTPPQNPGTSLASRSALRGSVMLLEIPLYQRMVSEPAEYGLDDLAEQVRGEELSEGKASLLICDSSVDREGLIGGIYTIIRREMGEKIEVEVEVSRSCEHGRILSPTSEPVIGRVRITRT